MGISRLTAYAIASNPDVICSAAGPNENEKFSGMITLGEDDRFRPLVTTDFVYETSEKAISEMQKVVLDLKESVGKETGGEDPITHLLGDELGSVVRTVVDASKG